MPAELQFTAMGTVVRVQASGVSPGALDEARSLIEDREARWSRFLPDSEVSRINGSCGMWTPVAPDTFRLIEAAVTAAELTDGHFDPTVLHALTAAGYDRSFELVAAREATGRGPIPWVPGVSAIELYEAVSAVRVTGDAAIDLGGMAKGHTADLVVDALMAAGATGALADLGGDIRVAGRSPSGQAWRVGAAHPVTGVELPAVALESGAVVTSTSARRQWMRGGDRQHHLIDPRTARPARSGLLSVTIIGSSAMWAEVVAKAVFVAGLDEGSVLVARLGATGWAIADSGQVIAFAGLEAFAA